MLLFLAPAFPVKVTPAWGDKWSLELIPGMKVLQVELPGITKPAGCCWDELSCRDLERCLQESLEQGARAASCP